MGEDLTDTTNRDKIRVIEKDTYRKKGAASENQENIMDHNHGLSESGAVHHSDLKNEQTDGCYIRRC